MTMTRKRTKTDGQRVMKNFRMYRDTALKLERLARLMRLSQTQVVEQAIAQVAVQRGV